MASAWAVACTGAQDASANAPANKPVAEKPDPDLMDALGQSIASLAEREAVGYTKVGRLWRGELAARERRGFLAVLVYGHCYRFLAVGGAGVSDLDLALLD